MPVLWLVGRLDAAQADAIRSSLPAAFASPALFLKTPAEALRHPDPPPDLIAVAQRRPTEFTRREAETLVGSHPLARLVVGLGPWCASHSRSEGLWPETATVSLRHLPERLSREAVAFTRGEPFLPRTAGREEAALRLSADGCDRTGPRGLAGTAVAVLGDDRPLADTLRDLLADAGASVALTPDAASLIFVDLGPDERRAFSLIESLRRRNPTARLVAVAAPPTPSSESRLHRSGADAILTKPFDLADLVAAAGR